MKVLPGSNQRILVQNLLLRFANWGKSQSVTGVSERIQPLWVMSTEMLSQNLSDFVAKITQPGLAEF